MAEYCSKCRARLDTKSVAPPYPLCPPEHKRLYDPVAWEKKVLDWLLPLHQKKERTPAAIRQKRYRDGNPAAMEKSKKRLLKRLREEIGLQKHEEAKFRSSRNYQYLRSSILRDRLKKLEKKTP